MKALPLFLLFVLFLFSAPIVLVSCSDDPVAVDETELGEETDPEDEPGLEFGSVSGIVTAANGVTPIPGATVRLSTDENNKAGSDFVRMTVDLPFSTSTPQTTTDSEGRFTLEGVASGDQTLIAEKGIFRAVIDVIVEANATVDAPALELEPANKVAYLTGDYDSMEEILTDELGLEAGVHLEEISTSELFAPGALSGYDMVFINCGSDVLWDIVMDEESFDLESLREYIRSGGVLYLSDLEMPLLWLLFPDDFPYDEYHSGEEGTVQAEVTDDNMADFISKSSVEIVYNLPGWMGMVGQSIPDHSEILLRGNFNVYDYDTGEESMVESEPLAIFLNYEEGAVLFTSFHNTGAATFDQRSVLIYYVFGFGGDDSQLASQSFAGVDYPAVTQKQQVHSGQAHRHDQELIDKIKVLTGRN